MAKDFELSFAGLALLNVQQELWFDDYRFARVAQNPADSQHAPAKDVFSNQSYFGTVDQPGPLAVFNNMALVGFKPTWKIQLQDTHTVNSASSTEAGLDISVLGLFSIGGYGGSKTNNTHYDNSTNTITINDDTNNVGFFLSFRCIRR